MRALADARQTIGSGTTVDPGAAGWSLFSRFADIALRHPGRLAVSDQTRRDVWSGRPQVEWTYGWALKMLDRLSAYLDQLALQPGSPVGICLANSSESYLAIIAVERSGLTPCLLPLTWSEETLSAAVASVRMQAVVTQAIVGDDSPAGTFCRIQSTHFRLRHILAFGPGLPRGVVDLDRVLMDPWLVTEPGETETPNPPSTPGIVTFGRRDAGLRPLFRTTRSLLAAAQSILAVTRARPAQRIVSLLPPDDLAGLATGIASSLLVEAALECHGVFGAASLIDSLEDSSPAHLVAPGWMEDTLAQFDLPEPISPVLVHQAPLRFRPNTALKNGSVDILSFGEVALLASPRSARGLFSLSLDRDRSGKEGERPTRTKIAADGSILFAGPGSEVTEFGDAAATTPADGWTSSGFSVERFAGVVIGVA